MVTMTHTGHAYLHELSQSWWQWHTGHAYLHGMSQLWWQWHTQGMLTCTKCHNHGDNDTHRTCLPAWTVTIMVTMTHTGHAYLHELSQSWWQWHTQDMLTCMKCHNHGDNDTHRTCLPAWSVTIMVTMTHTGHAYLHEVSQSWWQWHTHRTCLPAWSVTIMVTMTHTGHAYLHELSQSWWQWHTGHAYLHELSQSWWQWHTQDMLTCMKCHNHGDNDTRRTCLPAWTVTIMVIMTHAGHAYLHEVSQSWWQWHTHRTCLPAWSVTIMVTMTHTQDMLTCMKCHGHGDSDTQGMLDAHHHTGTKVHASVPLAAKCLEPAARNKRVRAFAQKYPFSLLKFQRKSQHEREFP